jgi:hypothetical protein
MGTLRLHPYLFATGAVVAVAIVGALIVGRGASAPLVSGQPQAWGGAGALLNPSYQAQQTAAQQTAPQVQNQPPYTYTLPALPPSQSQAIDQTDTSGSFDFTAFISTLTEGSAKQSASTPSGSRVSDAYSFIPQGLVSTQAPQKRTKLQQSLYDYGNDAGALISAFEQGHPNSTQVLTDQAQDRGSAEKAAAVEALGADLSALGDQLLALENVPSTVSDANASLAASYHDIGKKLALIPQAQSDADFLAAVNAYNDAVGTFVQRYVALAQLFVSYSVTFSSDDSGSVFTFTPTAL